MSRTRRRLRMAGLFFQGLRKPAFYAYQFLNRLGDVELTSNDVESWVCRSTRGVQVLFWNFTPPKMQESNQVFYKRDQPAKDFGAVQVSVAKVPPGAYQMKVHRVGYQVNDVYADYLKMGSPTTLSRVQGRELAEKK